MLKKNKPSKPRTVGGHYAIVASKYNGRYVDAMLAAAESCLEVAGAESIRVVRVPGAYEIPVVVARLARASEPRLDAIICLGVILRGATTHAQHVGEAVSNTLSQLQGLHEVPIIHEVLLLENEKQAKERCLMKDHNRGTEAARTALEMAEVMRSIG
jgi:6,7-dimethyl-8-ribityllumazine synthase